MRVRLIFSRRSLENGEERAGGGCPSLDNIFLRGEMTNGRLGWRKGRDEDARSERRY